MISADVSWQDRYFTGSDGLRLYARDYGPSNDAKTPVICLCGLTRTSREFHVLASHLSATRRVVCPDYRGRGLSQHSSDWKTYMPANEMADALTLLDELGIERAFVVGTSRGGLIAMLMAGLHKDRLAGAALNDIGPVIEPAGLARIVQYVGRMAEFDGWPQAVAALKRTNTGFEGMSDAEWDYFARFSFAERDGKPYTDYDANLARTMPSQEQILSGEQPDMWPFLEAMNDLPATVIRGEHSDLLSEQTLRDMARRLPGLSPVTIANRGHTPFLTEQLAVEAIEQALHKADHLNT